MVEYIHFRMRDGKKCVVALNSGRELGVISEEGGYATFHSPSDQGDSCVLVPSGFYCKPLHAGNLPDNPQEIPDALEEYLRTILEAAPEKANSQIPYLKLGKKANL